MKRRSMVCFVACRAARVPFEVRDKGFHLKRRFGRAVVQNVLHACLQPAEQLEGIDAVVGRMGYADVVPHIENVLELLIGSVGDQL